MNITNDQYMCVVKHYFWLVIDLSRRCAYFHFLFGLVYCLLLFKFKISSDIEYPIHSRLQEYIFHRITWESHWMRSWQSYESKKLDINSTLFFNWSLSWLLSALSSASVILSSLLWIDHACCSSCNLWISFISSVFSDSSLWEKSES